MWFLEISWETIDDKNKNNDADDNNDSSNTCLYLVYNTQLEGLAALSLVSSDCGRIDPSKNGNVDEGGSHFILGARITKIPSSLKLDESWSKSIPIGTEWRCMKSSVFPS